MSHRALVVLVATSCLAAPLLCDVPPATGAPPPHVLPYVPPVDAAVSDPFRPPSTPYGTGNRGLEYDTVPGAEVRAVADGVVTFAGAVAGTHHVTVRHGDGVRTSYSFLARIAVVAGQRVEQGTVVGTTAARLHLGARVGDAYFDPALLFGAAPPQVELVPFDELPGEGEAGERSALRQLVGGLGRAAGALAAGAADAGLAGTGATAAWLREEGGQLAHTAVLYGDRLSGAAQLRALLEIWSAATAAAARDCSDLDAVVVPPAQRRVALLVGGLGSTSESAAIDDMGTAGLGYVDADVLRFSYAGGRVPDPGDGLTAVDATTYDAADTQLDLRVAGARLADLVEAVAATAPGIPIDVYAHSQGGLVTRLALRELERRSGQVGLAHLGLVATFGTPHAGADLATAIYALGSTRVGSVALDAIAPALGLPLDDDAPSSAQLAESSTAIATLRRSPLPTGVRGISIAARGDVVVPVPSTRLPGAPQVVVPVSGVRAHDSLPASPEAAREVALALAGLPPTCTSLRTALTDQVVGQGISWAEDMMGAMAWAAAARLGPPLGG